MELVPLTSVAGDDDDDTVDDDGDGTLKRIRVR